MSNDSRWILVFGATGQQGGSVATALLDAGWRVRALVRDPASAKSRTLLDRGVQLCPGSFADEPSMRAAMHGAYGVFSMQPSSAAGPENGLSDDMEVQAGCKIADLALECGVRHFVYSSTNAVGATPTGMGHLDSKALIEAHVRALSMPATIVRPATFMDMLVMPGFGLDKGEFNFFLAPEQSMQLVAVKDIGIFVSRIFSEPHRVVGKTLELASDAVTGNQLGDALAEAAGRPIRYARFSEELLAGNGFLRRLTELLDAGRLTGHANPVELRRLHPQMLSLRSWLAHDGRQGLESALGDASAWALGRG